PRAPTTGAPRWCRPPPPEPTASDPGSVGGGLVGAPAPTDAGLEEAVEVAVEDRARVADLVAGAQVLDDLVGVQHVVAHLVAPAGLHIALELLHLGGLLGLLQGEELGLEDDHGAGLVLELALLVLAAHHDAGRDVGEPDRGVGGVDRLASRAGRAVD